MSNSKFQHLSAIANLGRIILCCGGPSCAMWEVWQHAWSLPIWCQEQPPVVTTKNLLRYFQMSPGWQIATVDKDCLLREFSVSTGCFCLHPFVQNLITWPFLIVKEAGWHLCSKIGSSSVAEGNKYWGTAPSLHHVGKENSCLKYLCDGAFYWLKGKTRQRIWLKYLGLEIWRLLHWKNSNW